MSATETPEVPLPDVPPLGNAPPLDFHWLKVALAQNLLGRVVPQPRAIAPHSGSPKKKKRSGTARIAEKSPEVEEGGSTILKGMGAP